MEDVVEGGEYDGEPKSKKQRLETLPKIIKDPIHGSVELHQLLYKIINTQEFNRLKFIRQLGGVFYVYPGATHTRFEHSIGVCYLAGEFIRILQRKQKNLKITDEEVLCVEIAGLCHDLGHGPFSHVFDKNILNECVQQEKASEKPEKIKHEEISLLIMERIFETLKEDFFKVFKSDAIRYMTMIKNMIHPNKEKLKEKEGDKYFLYQIVANKDTGIDVDKWDYFVRDCHYMGIPHDFDWKRLMQLSRVIDVLKKEEEMGDTAEKKTCFQICYNKKEYSNIAGMFRTRFNLHQKAYQHKTVLAIEERLSTGILKVKSEPLVFGFEKLSTELLEEKSEPLVLGFHGGDEKKSKKLSLVDIYGQLKKNDVSGFLALTDDIVHIIIHKAESDLHDNEQAIRNLTEAQTILRDLFYKREKFHLVGKYECALKDKIEEKLDEKYPSTSSESHLFFCKKVAISYFSEKNEEKQNSEEQNPDKERIPEKEQNSVKEKTPEKENPASQRPVLDLQNTSLTKILFFSKDKQEIVLPHFENEELCAPFMFEVNEVWLFSGDKAMDKTLKEVADGVKKDFDVKKQSAQK